MNTKRITLYKGTILEIYCDLQHGKATCIESSAQIVHLKSVLVSIPCSAQRSHLIVRPSVHPMSVLVFAPCPSQFPLHVCASVRPCSSQCPLHVHPSVRPLFFSGNLYEFGVIVKVVKSLCPVKGLCLVVYDSIHYIDMLHVAKQQGGILLQVIPRLHSVLKSLPPPM